MIEQRTTDPLDFCLDWKHWCKVKKMETQLNFQRQCQSNCFCFMCLLQQLRIQDMHFKCTPFTFSGKITRNWKSSS